jgi:hypothetical protein
MASVEQYLTVLAGAQSAQNAEAQRLAAQMQIEVRLPRDRSASGHIVTRSIRVAATAPFRPPPRRVDRSIPSFSHLFRCARERKLALLVPRQSAFRFSGTRPSSFARRATTEPKKKKLTVANRLLFIPHTRHTQTYKTLAQERVSSQRRRGEHGTRRALKTARGEAFRVRRVAARRRQTVEGVFKRREDAAGEDVLRETIGDFFFF